MNDDAETHNVLIPTGFSTDLGKQEPGSETTLTVSQAGMFDVECVIHDEMQTRVVVRP